MTFLRIANRRQPERVVNGLKSFVEKGFIKVTLIPDLGVRKTNTYNLW